jgi:tetratricopeptide (TPR) repeat protein
MVALLMGAGCRTDGERALDEGVKLLGSNDPADWDRAVDSFKRSIVTEVKSRNHLVSTWTRIARRQINEADKFTVGREEEMARLLEGGISRHMAMLEMEYQFYHSAISNLHMSLSVLPNDKNAHYLLGLAYGQLSRGKLNPSESDALLLKADEHYSIALRFDPEYIVALYGHAIVLILLERFHEAEQASLRLIRLEPREDRGYFALARAYFGMREFSKAENIYRGLLDLLPARSPKRAMVEENIRTLADHAAQRPR